MVKRKTTKTVRSSLIAAFYAFIEDIFVFEKKFGSAYDVKFWPCLKRSSRAGAIAETGGGKTKIFLSHSEVLRACTENMGSKQISFIRLVLENEIWRGVTMHSDVHMDVRFRGVMGRLHRVIESAQFLTAKTWKGFSENKNGAIFASVLGYRYFYFYWSGKTIIVQAHNWETNHIEFSLKLGNCLQHWRLHYESL